jgi:hypothetical protein
MRYILIYQYSKIDGKLFIDIVAIAEIAIRVGRTLLFVYINMFAIKIISFTTLAVGYILSFAISSSAHANYS